MRWAFLAVLLVGCGSGAVTDPASNPAPVIPPLVVNPPSATAYPGFVTLFDVSGGTGAGISLTSTNQAVVSFQATDTGFAIVPNTVPADTAVTLIVRDLGSSSSVNVPITVKAIPTAPLGVKPAAVSFQGIAPGTCASGIQADVIVFGGAPPYVISQPGLFNVQPSVLTSNPGRVTITAIGQCGTAEIGIVDAAGHTTSVQATNTLSTAVSTPAPILTVSPAAVSLISCTDVAKVVLLGGSGNYFATSGNDSVFATVEGGNTGFIRRAKPSPSSPASVPVTFSDGRGAITVTVTLSGSATGPCTYTTYSPAKTRFGGFFVAH